MFISVYILCEVFMIPKGRIYFASDPKHSLLHEHSITRINFLIKHLQYDLYQENLTMYIVKQLVQLSVLY